MISGKKGKYKGFLLKWINIFSWNFLQRLKPQYSLIIFLYLDLKINAFLKRKYYILSRKNEMGKKKVQAYIQNENSALHSQMV